MMSGLVETERKRLDGTVRRTENLPDAPGRSAAAALSAHNQGCSGQRGRRPLCATLVQRAKSGDLDVNWQTTWGMSGDWLGTTDESS